MRGDWAECKLGNLVEHEKGKKPRSQNSRKTNKFQFPYIDIKAFEKDVVTSYTDGENCTFCDEQDLLMVWDGARSGLVGRATKGALGSTLMRINFPRISNEYGFFFLKAKYLEINTNGKGTGTPHVNPDLLWNYIFPLPPHPEQRAIVKKIETLFDLIDESKKEIESVKGNLKLYRQAILKKAFEGKLLNESELEICRKDPEWKPAEELLKEINPKAEYKASKVREDWVECKLDVFLDYIQPQKYIVSSTSFDDAYDTPVLTAGKSFIKGYTDEKDNVFKDFPVIIFDDFTTATQFVDFEFKVKSSAMKILVPRSHLLNIKYAYYFVKTVKVNTSTHKRYWISIFSKCLIKTAPFPEQKAIVRKIENLFKECDSLESTIEEKVKSLESLRQSILEKAFAGELLSKEELDQCKKASGYKPAKELLEEIKKEKQNNQKTRKISKKKRGVCG